MSTYVQTLPHWLSVLWSKKMYWNLNFVLLVSKMDTRSGKCLICTIIIPGIIIIFIFIHVNLIIVLQTETIMYIYDGSKIIIQLDCNNQVDYDINDSMLRRPNVEK